MIGPQGQKKLRQRWRRASGNYLHIHTPCILGLPKNSEGQFCQRSSIAPPVKELLRVGFCTTTSLPSASSTPTASFSTQRCVLHKQEEDIQYPHCSRQVILIYIQLHPSTSMEQELCQRELLLFPGGFTSSNLQLWWDAWESLFLPGWQTLFLLLPCVLIAVVILCITKLPVTSKCIFRNRPRKLPHSKYQCCVSEML